MIDKQTVNEYWVVADIGHIGYLGELEDHTIDPHQVVRNGGALTLKIAFEIYKGLIQMPNPKDPRLPPSVGKSYSMMAFDQFLDPQRVTVRPIMLTSFRGTSKYDLSVYQAQVDDIVNRIQQASAGRSGLVLP
jgi:hypothetical protein